MLDDPKTRGRRFAEEAEKYFQPEKLILPSLCH